MATGRDVVISFRGLSVLWDPVAKEAHVPFLDEAAARMFAANLSEHLHPRVEEIEVVKPE